MTEQKEVKITAAKGRPMLTWVGKRPLRRVTALPAQNVEIFDPTGQLGKCQPNSLWEDWPDGYSRGGLLFHGDNKEVLAHLLANGFRNQVKLIYIDPPFDSGADYVRKVQLRGMPGIVRIDGEAYSLGEQIQYTDVWASDNYLQFMYERLLLIKELLADDGLLFVHLDSNRVHYIRIILDEIFGEKGFINEIIWQQTSAHNDPGRFGKVHNNILLYAKSPEARFDTKLGSRSQSYIENWFKYALGPNGEVITIKKGEKVPEGYRRFRLSDLRSPHPRPNLMYEFKGYQPHANGWAVSLKRMEEYDRQNRLHYPASKAGRIQLRNFLDEMDGAAIQDMWWDLVTESSEEELLENEAEAVTDTWRGIRTLQGNSSENQEYPTQKPEELLKRIIETSSHTGDLVMDCYSGSGTTLAVAQKLGRRWIGCDINKGAIQTVSKRIQRIIRKQADESNCPRQVSLIPVDEGTESNTPPQLGFSVWRVNDYDLAIQHNEAVNLACEHIGVERTRADGFFDGTLHNRLVKIVPLDHPLSPLDLEEVKRELEARPQEDRDIVLVCLGKELAADAWVDDWNRLRKEQNSNRIEIIELRTDSKYGKFIVHEPSNARVSIQRKGSTIKVEVRDFISPTIVQRLDMDMPLFKAKITDWRNMVDCILIDPAYDGQVFNVALSDVPERKDDLVIGEYELPASDGETMVAVKVIDMLGEEVLVTNRV